MRRSVLRALLGAALVITVVPNGVGRAATSATGLRLVSVVPHLDVPRFGGDPNLFFSPGVYAAASTGTFEIDAVRGSHGTVQLYPMTRDSTGAHRGKVLTTPSPVTIGDGLPSFFHVTLRSASGRLVADSTQPFCPGGWFGESRVNASGPDRPAYPYFCGSDLTKATVWGIDKGWASQLFFALDGSNAPDGDYTLGVSIDKSYVRQLALDSTRATAAVAVTITTDPGTPCPPEIACLAPARSRARVEGPGQSSKTESTGNEGLQSDGVPNLQALPAHDLSMETIDGRDYLDFGATIWNSGSGPLVVEGFRDGPAQTMPATQFVYQNGKPSSSKVIGQFEFDTRPGHNHWHMEDVAAYDLLDASGQRVVLSDKQSFCLAPTDPIDLVAPGADWQPDRAGLWSACSGSDAIWLREVLPAGWGDTYFQNVAGQSFDITDLPNGSYQLRVTTDPFHTMLETSYADNASLLPIVLGGVPGARTVSG